MILMTVMLRVRSLWSTYYVPSPVWRFAQSCRLFATLWTVAYQASPSMGFSRQEYWSGLPFPSPGDLSRPRDQTQASHISGRWFNLWAMLTVVITKYLSRTYDTQDGAHAGWGGGIQWWIKHGRSLPSSRLHSKFSILDYTCDQNEQINIWTSTIRE